MKNILAVKEAPPGTLLCQKKLLCSMVFKDKDINKKMTPFFVEYSFLLNHVERFPNSLVFSQYVEIIQF